MTDYINREDALKALTKSALDRYSLSHKYDIYINALIDASDAIKSIHPADVREIIRCKDCKWHEIYEPGMVYCPNIVGGWIQDDFYCACGARMDGESDG